MVDFDPEAALSGWCTGCAARTALPFDGPGTKVLVVGDVHGDMVWMEEQVIPYAKATGCSKVMQLGDFGMVWNDSTVHAELDDLNESLENAGLTLIFLPGNHENHPLLALLAGAADQNEDGHYMLRPHVFYTGRLSAWTWDGLRMAAVGGACSIDRSVRIEGVSWWPEESLRPEEVAAATQLGPVDILFTHDAPMGVPMRLIPDVGSAAHRVYMTQIAESLGPSYWYHGHYHEPLYYRFHHPQGVATVRGLDCNHTEVRTDAMAPINLQSISDGLNMTRYRPEA
jgi:predicted phosphodiesterase